MWLVLWMTMSGMSHSVTPLNGSHTPLVSYCLLCIPVQRPMKSPISTYSTSALFSGALTLLTTECLQWASAGTKCTVVRAVCYRTSVIPIPPTNQCTDALAIQSSQWLICKLAVWSQHYNGSSETVLLKQPRSRALSRVSKNQEKGESLAWPCVASISSSGALFSLGSRGDHWPRKWMWLESWICTGWLQWHLCEVRSFEPTWSGNMVHLRDP